MLVFIIQVAIKTAIRMTMQFPMGFFELLNLAVFISFFLPGVPERVNMGNNNEMGVKL